MPFMLVSGDITRISADAIVNAANPTLLGGGGVDGAIHRAAGKELLSACRKLGGCKTGQAKITGAYRLPCKYVIHTVGPVYRDGRHGEETQLRSCYRESLGCALANGCESVAFPLISAGVYGYPKGEALRVVVSEITAFLAEHEMQVTLVIYEKGEFQPDRQLIDSLAAYIGKQYASELPPAAAGKGLPRSLPRPQSKQMRDGGAPEDDKAICFAGAAESLDDALKQMDESFSEMLLRKIDEKGMTDAQCYKRANIDRKLFSKIRSDPHYKTGKTTAVAFAVALELSPEDTRELLMKAGFALSHSNKFDIIVEYFLKQGNYNIFEINEALFAFDQPLLGGGFVA